MEKSPIMSDHRINPYASMASDRKVREYALIYALCYLNTKPGMPAPIQADVARMIGVDPRRFSEALTAARQRNLLKEVFIRAAIHG